MEDVLDVYKRPVDAAHPVVCMDEMPKQLIGEIRSPEPMKPGQPKRQDYEYVRHGTAAIFMVPRCFTWVMMLLIERMKLTHQRRVFASLPKASEAISRDFQEKLPDSVSLSCAVLTTIKLNEIASSVFG